MIGHSERSELLSSVFVSIAVNDVHKISARQSHGLSTTIRDHMFG